VKWIIVSSLFAASIAALSGGQALVLGRTESRAGPYWIVWLGSSMMLAWTFGAFFLLGSTALYAVPRGFYVGVVVVALSTSAAALWRGARKGASRLPIEEPFLGRVLAVAGIHVAVVFVGWCLAFAVVAMVAMSQIH
jgi:uncharacterized membrane protein YiaA